ncbi:MAG: serpin family protein [Cyclobacteriaceae bacterium]
MNTCRINFAKKAVIARSWISTSLWVMIFLFVSLMSSCEITPEPGKKPTLRNLSPQEAGLVQATNQVALNILKSLQQEQPEENIFLSPFSVSMALGTLQNGTSGNAHMEIADMLNTQHLSNVELNKIVSNLLNMYKIADRELDFSLASSIWHSDKLKLEAAYENIVMAYYDTEIRPSNFSKNNAHDLINRWSELRTRGKSGGIIREIPSDFKYMMVSTAHFSAGDHLNFNEFDLTPAPFYTNANRTVESTFMNARKTEFKYFRDNNISYFELPLGKGLMNLCLLVPDKNYGIADMLANLETRDLDLYEEMALNTLGNISLPIFTTEYSTRLNHTLSNMGIREVFEGNPDFSIISKEEIKLDELRHKAMFNFASFQPSSKTSDVLEEKSSLLSYSIDRPFVYFIRDKHTTSLIMEGIFTNPTNN